MPLEHSSAKCRPSEPSRASKTPLPKVSTLSCPLANRDEAVIELVGVGNDSQAGFVDVGAGQAAVREPVSRTSSEVDLAVADVGAT